VYWFVERDAGARCGRHISSDRATSISETCRATATAGPLSIPESPPCDRSKQSTWLFRRQPDSYQPQEGNELQCRSHYQPTYPAAYRWLGKRLQTVAPDDGMLQRISPGGAPAARPPPGQGPPPSPTRRGRHCPCPQLGGSGWPGGAGPVPTRRGGRPRVGGRG
jgi:hypothetical protein